MDEKLKPTHYCVVCGARWVQHNDETWSVLTDCGPCCDNRPMNEAPIVEFESDGSIHGEKADAVRRKWDSARRAEHVERYRGVLCALCDEPFERHSSQWHCRHAIAPRFKFPRTPSRNDVLEEAAAWHDQRAKDTPDAFEMEFHQASAAAIRARKD